MPPDAFTPAKSASRTWRRKLAYALIALAAGILLLSVLTRRTPDAVRSQLDAIRAAGEPIDAASLATWISPVPDSENGAPKLLEQIDGLRRVDRGKIPKRARSWDAATLSWADAERTRLQSWRNDIHATLQAKRFQYPGVFTNDLAAIRNDHGEQMKLASGALAFWAAHSAVLKQEDPSPTLSPPSSPPSPSTPPPTNPSASAPSTPATSSTAWAPMARITKATPPESPAPATPRPTSASPSSGEGGRHTVSQMHAPRVRTRANAHKTRAFCRLSSRPSLLPMN
jgi:hypothetical protein